MKCDLEQFFFDVIHQHTLLTKSHYKNTKTLYVIHKLLKTSFWLLTFEPDSLSFRGGLSVTFANFANCIIVQLTMKNF